MTAQFVVIRGRKIPSPAYNAGILFFKNISTNCTSEAIVKGDLKEPSIGAASIIAKVERDKEISDFDVTYPGYGFAKHKGYPTKLHMEAVQKLGVCLIHRKSFAPVKRLLNEK